MTRDEHFDVADEAGGKAILEALLVVAPEGVGVEEAAETLGWSPAQVEAALKDLRADYDGQSGSPRGFELRLVGGRWRLYSRPRWAPWVEKFVVGDQSSSLSRAALETLAIIAYRQPVTRTQIAQIRGVNVDSVLRTLQARDLIDEDGSSPTGAHLFRTTPTFLERLGLTSLEDLSPLAPHVPGPEDAAHLAEELF